MGILLKDLSDEGCFSLYDEMMKNSDRRWKSARLLAENEDYGGAIRDHITSMEEMIKAFIMFLDSRGFQFRTVEGMDSIIRRNHTIRHFIGFTMFVMNIFIDDLKGMVLKIRKDPSVILKYKENKTGIDSLIKMYALRKMVVVKEEFYWFSKVEKYRQEGTHVDYDPTIKTPLSITHEDYQEVYKRLENVRVVGKGIIESFDTSDEELLKHIEELKQEFITEDWYTMIKETLISTKNGRKNPFDLFEKHWE
jgi:AbiV family abortive infection protein